MDEALMGMFRKDQARGVLRRAFEAAPDVPPDFKELLSKMESQPKVIHNAEIHTGPQDKAR
jgi:hypothetical protein